MKFLYNLFTEDEQKILFFLVFFCLLGMCLHYVGLSADNEAQLQADSLKQVVQTDYQVKFDLKTVTKEELVMIPGIGPKRAEAILNFRDQNGFNFRTDLMNIKGIGPKSFERIRDYFLPMNNEIEDKAIDSFKDSVQEDKLETQSSVGIVLIDINKADSEELCKLKGIGPKKAADIIALRNDLGKFSNINQLLQVKGIGEKTLEKIKDSIFIGEGR